jgi:hypothetical protein
MLTPLAMRRALAISLLMLLGAGAAGCDALLPETPGAVLFQDDFSRSSSGWDTYDEPDYRAGYVEGGLRIHVNAPNSLAWSTPGFELTDVRLVVDTAARGGPEDNAFGLICRYQDPGNYAFLLISSDGYSGIGMVRDGQRNLLTGDAMLPSESILQGMSANHLRADCSGPRLALYINGELANEVTIDEVAAGDVGVIVGTYAGPGAEIDFDNFTISNP